jgi:hypothetical protein
MDLTMSILSTITAAVGAIAAVGSWRAAWQSQQAAATMKSIEQERHRVELTPWFDIICRVTDGDHARLLIGFIGPPGLACLDEVSLSIRDDHRREPAAVGGPTDEQIRQQVWGPYRFVHNTGNPDRTGRTVPPFAPDMGNEYPFMLERTQAPSWSHAAESWRQDRDGTPLRLAIACRNEMYAWTAWYDVHVVDSPAS